jgi:hypothetical protein
MPVGQVVVVGGYLYGAPTNIPVLPGGMFALPFPFAPPGGFFFMIVAGWVAFTGLPPL